MPTKDQVQMRAAFLAAYFDGPPELRRNLKKSLAQAGYTKTSITFKQGKFRGYIAEEEQRRGQLRSSTPSHFRDPHSGKIIFPTQDLPGERRTEGTELTPSSVLNTAPPVDLRWYNDPIDGREQRLYFDHNGTFKCEENFGQRTWRPSRSFADSYAPRYRGLDGELHVFGDAERPIYRGLELDDIFPVPVDLLPDELPQGYLTKDSSLTQQILQQATKGFYA